MKWSFATSVAYAGEVIGNPDVARDRATRVDVRTLIVRNIARMGSPSGRSVRSQGHGSGQLGQAALCADLQLRAGALHAQFSPQLHLGPQVQGWQAHCFF